MVWPDLISKNVIIDVVEEEAVADPVGSGYSSQVGGEVASARSRKETLYS